MANTILLSQILKARPAVCPTIYGNILPDVPNHNGYIKIGYTDKVDVEKRIHEHSENFNKELENVKKTQAEMKKLSN